MSHFEPLLGPEMSVPDEILKYGSGREYRSKNRAEN